MPDDPAIVPIKKQTLSEAVMEQLSQLILDGHFPPGTRLPTERDLAHQFGVARSRVREALRGLAMVGMIQIRPGEGSFVSEATTLTAEQVLWMFRREKEDVVQVYEARRLIETELIVLAAQNGTPEQKEQIYALWQQMAQTAGTRISPSAFVEMHTQFHNAIGEAAGNRVLTLLTQALRMLQEQAHLRILRLPGARENSIRQDGKLAAAIRAGDTAAARQAARDHYDSAIRLLEQDGDADEESTEDTRG